MPTRRELLGLALVAASTSPLLGQSPRRIRAIAFDAFVLFSPQTVAKRAREIAGEKGVPLFTAASTTLFGYTWYYTSAGRYAEFDELAADAFSSAAQSLGLSLSDAELHRLVSGYGKLTVWPDVPEAVETLRHHGIRLAMLSNLSSEALRANLSTNQIQDHFEFVLSTDEAQQYKPSPKAYNLASGAFRIPRSEIGFAASASWDASGATWFGFPTVWVNRNGMPGEQAHAMPELVSDGMKGVLKLVGFGDA
jgi:2-haloacid dehalogenase